MSDSPAPSARKSGWGLLPAGIVGWLVLVGLGFFLLGVLDQLRYRLDNLSLSDERHRQKIDALEAENAGLRAYTEATAKLAKTAADTAARALCLVTPPPPRPLNFSYVLVPDGKGGFEQKPLWPDDRIPPQQLPVTPKEK